ncbi:MAG: hypothetical protein PPP56_09425 [Longimonas sp.]|uniref:hypothetical protein n=1 Tax=Longimonas sp. TaxID=2039626 RepID=UPI0033469CB7
MDAPVYSQSSPSPEDPVLTTHELLMERVLSISADAQLHSRLTALERERDTGEFVRIMEELEALSAAFPDNGEVLWRLARTRTDVAEREPNEERREALLRQSLTDAERAVELLPEHSNAHLTKAVAAGRTALVAGTRERVELSRTVYSFANRAIELDPQNDLAYHVRGRWAYEVAGLGFVARRIVQIVYGGLPSASYADAAADYQQAIDLEERVVHRFELGRTYIEMDRPDSARAQLQRVLDLPIGDVADPLYKARAERLLANL